MDFLMNDFPWRSEGQYSQTLIYQYFWIYERIVISNYIDIYEKINNISYSLSRFYHELSYKAIFKM